MNFEQQHRLEESRSKKLILLVSDNALWRGVRRLEEESGFSLDSLRTAALESSPSANNSIIDFQEIKLNPPPSTRHGLLGISLETLRKMSHGNLAKGNRISIALDNLQKILLFFSENYSKIQQHRVLVANNTAALCELSLELSKIVADFKDEISANDINSISLYGAGKILGMTNSDVQQAIDSAILHEYPLLSRPYISSYSEADSIYRQIGGVYYAWMFRCIGTNKEKYILMKCCLHVRYVLKYSNKYIIRSKLNIPKINKTALDRSRISSDKNNIYEYDGFISIEGGKIYWVFERRSPARTDYIYWITSQCQNKIVNDNDNIIMRDFVGFLGYYLTAHQDPAQTIVTGHIIIESINMEYINEESFENNVRLVMKNDPCVYSHGSKEYLFMDDFYKAAICS